MGQRTQIIVRHKDAAGATTVKVKHLQWGIGRITPMHAMAHMNRLMLTGRNEVRDKHDEIELAGDDLTEAATIPTDELPELLGCFDNNNGGVAIDCRTDTDGRTTGTVGFVVGEEDDPGRAYHGYVSIEEWFRATDEEQILAEDPDFLPMWHAWCRWAELDEIQSREARP